MFNWKWRFNLYEEFFKICLCGCPINNSLMKLHDPLALWHLCSTQEFDYPTYGSLLWTLTGNFQINIDSESDINSFIILVVKLLIILLISISIG